MGGIMLMQMSHRSTANATPTTMRSLLSVSGQTAYDAASDDSWFNVSAADYAAVASGHTGTSKIGMTDAQVTVVSPSAFVGTYGITLPQANATVPVGNYVFGFVFRGVQLVSCTLRPYISTTFKGTYTTLGANIISAPSSTSPLYYLRKNPASAVASTSYVAAGPRSAGGGNWAATGVFAGSGYSANMSTWTLWNTNTPIQQWLISTTTP